MIAIPFRALRRRRTAVAVAALICASCGEPAATMDPIAESYVKLVLGLGTHDRDYVDAYYGPADWRAEVQGSPPGLEAIIADAEAQVGRLADVRLPDDELLHLRREYLSRQLASLVARAQMLAGHRLSFDEESAALYDAVAPRSSEEYFQTVLARMEAELPGSGPVALRYDRYRTGFVIPPERLDTVFKAAIAECRTRTLRHLTLPAEESFTVEYVTDKSWSGYNWYQGEFRSLIQVNTDLPIYVDRAVDLACHEGYPGHHTYNVLLEKHLVRDRGWMEYSVYPLFSPQSLIAEGSANYGIRMAFPGGERLEFERRVLFPLAGLDGSQATRYYEIQALAEQLSYAGNEAARRYLDGAIDAQSAASWLERYSLMTSARARQRVRFIDQYRSYVINYNLGQDLVAAHIAARAGDPTAQPARAWEEFGKLLSSPRLPSGLATEGERGGAGGER